MRFKHTCEFNEKDHRRSSLRCAFVLCNFRVDEFAAVGSSLASAGFVLTHEAAVASDIGGKNGRKTTLYPLPAQLPAPEGDPSVRVALRCSFP